MSKQLGKITHCEFGIGGYQDAMFGLSVTLEGKGFGISDFISGGWSEIIKISEYTKWTEEDRSAQRVDMIKKVNQILIDANVDHISQLKGKPVEMEIEYNTLKSWRILTEVL